MSTIESFHETLSKRPGRRNPYLSALLALTRLTPFQVHALTGDMIWLEW